MELFDNVLFLNGEVSYCDFPLMSSLDCIVIILVNQSSRVVDGSEPSGVPRFDPIGGVLWVSRGSSIVGVPGLNSCWVRWLVCGALRRVGERSTSIMHVYPERGSPQGTIIYVFARASGIAVFLRVQFYMYLQRAVCLRVRCMRFETFYVHGTKAYQGVFRVQFLMFEASFVLCL